MAVLAVFNTCEKEDDIKDDKVTYENDVKPILVNHCAPCHVAGGTHPSKYDNYTVAWDDICGIIDRVGSTQGSARFMPKGGSKLSDEEILLLNQWVADGTPEKKGVFRENNLFN
jgi:hypothetical protein